MTARNAKGESFLDLSIAIPQYLSHVTSQYENNSEAQRQAFKTAFEKVGAFYVLWRIMQLKNNNGSR